MSTFIIAFIIFALAGLGIRHYIKGKGFLWRLCSVLVRLRKKCIRLIANNI